MTSDTGARVEDTKTTSESVAMDTSASMAKRYFKVAIVFLGLGLLLLLTAAIKRVWPDFLGGIEVLTYGRVAPVAVNLLLYGWLTIGMLGAMLYIVPRAANVDIGHPGRVRIGLWLLTVAYLGGAVAVLAGFTEARRYLESPLVFDLVALVGLVIVAMAVTSVARAAERSTPVLWYSTAAVLWLILAHVVGNVPGVSGYTGQMQTSFYRSSYVGLWVASAAVAVVYYVIPRLSGRPAFEGSRLTVLGIWSLGFAWAMTGPAELTFGASPDWLETIGVIFSIVLFLPILVIATDLVHGMRGAWGNVVDRATLRFVLSGVVLLVVYALFNLLQALRASAVVVGFTDWVAGTEMLVLLGPFTFILLGLMRHAAPAVFGGAPRGGMGAYRLTGFGLTTTVGAMAVAGVQTGFTWAGAANSGEFTNTGDGFVSTVAPLAGNYVVQLVGMATALLGVAYAVFGAVRGHGAHVEPEAAAAAPSNPDLELTSPPTIRKVRRYAYGFFALSLLVVLVFPGLEGESPTLLADTSRTYEAGSLVATGRGVYMQQGCASCHTQQVRPVVTDVGLGPVTVLGDYALATPVLIGIQRYGPDLTHLGARTVDAAAIQAHLVSPRDARPWSIMPSYDYLSTDDLAALTAYLVGEE